SSRTMSRDSSLSSMSRTLGIDLGTNSISWAEVENEKLLRAGARIYPTGPVARPRHFSLPKLSAEQAARYALLTIAGGGFALAAFFAPQFWASVAFSALIGWLSLFKQ